MRAFQFPYLATQHRIAVLRAVLLTAFLTLPLHTAAQNKVLFIGNSFTEASGGETTVPGIFDRLAQAGGHVDPLVVMRAVGGQDFRGHSTDSTTLATINSQVWTHVVLQNYSTEPTHYVDGVHSLANHHTYGTSLYDSIIANNPFTRIILFETWSRSAAHGLITGTSTTTSFESTDEFQTELFVNYSALAGNLNLDNPDVPMVNLGPVGDAWQLAGGLLPASDPSYFPLFAVDEYHGNNNGYYLTAAVFYSRIYGVSPEGLHSHPLIAQLNLGLTDAQFTLLEGIAWQTVNAEGVPEIIGPAFVFATVNLPFSYTITATNDPTSYSASNLPPGINFPTSSGILDGIPTIAGAYLSTLNATNAFGTGELLLAIDVAKAPATVLLANLFHGFDGTPKAPTVITSPPDLPVDVLYDGNLNPPISPGSYDVTATINSPSYEGYTSGTLYISDSPPPPPKFIHIDFGGITTTNLGNAPDDPVNYWNNITTPIGTDPNGNLPNLVTTGNAPTTVDFVMLSRFNGRNEDGTTASSLFAANATFDTLYGNTETFGGLTNVFPSFKLTDLDPDSLHNFTFYSSRTGVSDNRETTYTVSGTNFDSVTLDPANNIDNTVSVSNIVPTPGGEITIAIGPGAGNNSSVHFTYLGVVTVEVISPPIVFTTQPQSQSVPEGQAATFFAEVAGLPPLFVQWYADGVPIPGADSLVYTTPPASSAMNGVVYSVTVTNADSSAVSDDAILNVTASVGSSSTILIDFGGDAVTTTGASPNDPVNAWNNVTTAMGIQNDAVLANLVTTTNEATSVALRIVSGFAGRNESGTTEVSPFATNAAHDTLFGNTEDFNGLSNIFPQFALEGLDPAVSYNLTFYASRTGVIDNRETGYTVTGANTGFGALNAANNVAETVTVGGIVPTPAGTITVSVAPTTNNNNSYHFTYLGVLKITGAAIAPAFSPEAGSYQNGQLVSITSPTPNATIYYTLDCTIPTAATGMEYSDPVEIDATSTLRAIAVTSGWFNSLESSGLFNIIPPAPLGTILREVWLDVNTAQIWAIPVDTPPDSTGSLTSLEVPSNVGDLYGQRLRGHLVPSTSGDYTFWISGDNNCELWLSTSSDPADRVLVAFVDGYTNKRQWNKFSSQQSVPITLVADQDYYIEVLMKEKDQADNLAVAWRLNSSVDPVNGNDSDIVQGSNLRPWVGQSTPPQVATPEMSPSPGIYANPQLVSLSTSTANASIRYTTDGSTPTSTQGLLYSATGPFTVSATTTVRAIGYSNCFDDSDVAVGTFEIKVATPVMSPTPGIYADPQLVSLSTTTTGADIRYTTDGSTPTSTQGLLYSDTGPFTVSTTTTVRAIGFMSGIDDSDVAVGTFTIGTPPAPLGTILREVWLNVPTAQVWAIPVDTPPDTTGSLTSLEAPSNVGDLYGQRLRGYLVPSTSGDYTFWISGDNSCELWLSTSSDPADKVLVAFVDGYTSKRQWNKFSSQQSVPITLVADQDYYIEVLMKEKDQSDHVAVAWRLNSSVDPVNGSDANIILGANLRPWTGPPPPPPPVATPVFSPLPGTFEDPQLVSLSTTTTGADIRYTIDGSTPTPTQGLLYSNTGPFTVSATTTVRAIGFMSGTDDSDLAVGTFTIKVATPVFSPLPGAYEDPQLVSLSTTTTGADIRYTIDGSTPTPTQGLLYSNTGPFTVSATTTVRAIGFMSGIDDSDLAVGTFEIKVAAPVFSPLPGIFEDPQLVSLSTTTTGADIRYTIDGSTPTSTQGLLYSDTGPFTVSATTTVRAIGFTSGIDDSDLAVGTFEIQVATPVISPLPGVYPDSQLVSLSTTTTGADIRYTIDGSTPTSTQGLLYSSTGPFTVSATTTVRAIGFMSGIDDSDLAVGTFEIKVATPVFSPLPGTFEDPQLVSLSTTTTGADIRYTIDGSTPTSTQGLLYSSTGPFTVSATTTVRAIGFMSGIDDSDLAVGTFTFAPPAPLGTILREVWLNVPTAQVWAIPVDTPPDTTGSLTSLEAPSNVGDLYGQRLRGYLVPSTSGDYTFWVSGDNNCELWLSTSSDPTDKVLVAFVDGYTNLRQWNKFSSQQSVPIALIADQNYYIEVLMKEKDQADNLAVAWRLNSSVDPANGNGSDIIPGSNLRPF